MMRRARPDGGNSGEPVSVDMILELLSQYQRREMIRHLQNTPGNVHSIDEVLDHLMAIERQKQGDVPGEDHLLSVLVHIHGPKLEEAGIIDYDVPTREIRYYPDERIERALELIDELSEDIGDGRAESDA